MKRSSSLPHIPLMAPPAKRRRHNVHPAKTHPSSSLLQLPDDILTRIFYKVLNSSIIDVTTTAHLPHAFRFASTCRRLRYLFFASIRTIDCTLRHASHSLPEHYHNKQCTTCPCMVAFPIVHVLIQRAGFHLQALRLPALDVESTALAVSSVCEHAPQLRELMFTDRGAINEALAIALSSMSSLKHLSVCEPAMPLLKHLVFSSASLTNLALLSVSTNHAPHVTRVLSCRARNLRSLRMTFFDERRFLSDPFAFPRLNLHRVYPDMRLDIAKGITSLLEFLTERRTEKLPLLTSLALTTVGVDLNQEGCDLINCPPPVHGLDAMCGTVHLVRNATAPRDVAHPLRKLTLRTDHLLLNASLHALKGLLSPRVDFTLLVNDLTLAIPSLAVATSATAAPIPAVQSKAAVKADALAMLHHHVHAVRLESVLRDDVSISKYSNFGALRTLDISSLQFCQQYGRNPEAYRPRLISLLKTAGTSLKTIRIMSFAKAAPESSLGLTYIIDVLSHAECVETLEVSDQFLITIFYRDNLTTVFTYLRNLRTIRFGSLKWMTYHTTGNFTRAITEFFQVLGDFFRFVGLSCPLLTKLIMVSVYHEERAARFRESQSLRKAVRELDALQARLPQVDTCTVRAQLKLWLGKGKRGN